MKVFSWDCPKCESRARVDLPLDADVELRCKSCGWIVGEGVDLSAKALRLDRHDSSPPLARHTKTADSR
jgi:hypothetical protein